MGAGVADRGVRTGCKGGGGARGGDYDGQEKIRLVVKMEGDNEGGR